MKSPVIPFFCSALIGFMFLTTACSSTQDMSSPSFDLYTSSEPISESLFESKDRTLSEESIQKLLSGTIELPEQLRIAIYNHQSYSLTRYYNNYWQNEEFLKLKQSHFNTLKTFLTQSDRSQKVMAMPGLLVNQDAGIVQLREAAVRLQSDLLLIYDIKSDIYQKYRVFQQDEVKAFATTELLLMDIRTGMIPFSTVITRDTLIKKLKSDTDIQETRKRAEHAAINQALDQAGQEILAFLEE